VTWQTEAGFSDDYQKGLLFAHRGQFEKARQSFQDALDRERSSGNTVRLTVILGNLGNTLAVLGEEEAARSCYEELLNLPNRNEYPGIVGQTLVNLGNLAREKGEAERARAYYLEAIDFLEKAGDPVALGTLKSNFGLLARDAGKYEEGISCFKEAIRLHKSTGNEEGLAATWLQLGRILRCVPKRPGESPEICFNYAWMHFHQLGNPAGEREALKGLADHYESEGEREQALLCMNRILETVRRFGLAPNDDEDRMRMRLAQNVRK